MKNFLIAFVLLFGCCPVFAWDGYDYQGGNYIEIEEGNLVRPGNDIEIYDYGTGRYKDVEVQSINGDEIEVYDHETGQFRTFDMD